MTSMKIVQYSRPPHPFVQLPPKFFHPLTLDVPFQTYLPFLSKWWPINQKEGQRSAFVFSINSLILPGFPLTSFNLVEANLFPRATLKNLDSLFRLPHIAKRRTGFKVDLKPHCLLFSGFTILRKQLFKKIQQNIFSKKVFLVLIFQLICFICITWKRKQTMEKQPHRACEWTKSNQNKNK